MNSQAHRIKIERLLRQLEHVVENDNDDHEARALAGAPGCEQADNTHIDDKTPKIGKENAPGGVGGRGGDGGDNYDEEDADEEVDGEHQDETVEAEAHRSGGAAGDYMVAHRDSVPLDEEARRAQVNSLPHKSSRYFAFFVFLRNQYFFCFCRTAKQRRTRTNEPIPPC